MSLSEYVTETLAWCNAQRELRGKKPLKKLPKGQRGIGSSCPCGKATGLHVGARYYGEDSKSLDRPLPPVVIRFVRAFDSGHFPQYEARS